MSKNTVIKQQAAAKAEVILLGIDVDADKQVVVRQIDGQMAHGTSTVLMPPDGVLMRGTRA